MKVVRPLPINLAASSVPETDYPAWAAGVTYAAGARVAVTALHRVFESVVGGNAGHDPATAGTSYWIDAGPTNRWAMFDPAAGPATSSTAPIVVTLALADLVDAIGLVDLQAASVRVQLVASGVTIFDQTRTGPAACEVFLGLPLGSLRNATITITPSPGAAAIVGKLIAGAALDLGTLGDAPTVGLTDFSKRETDAFGITTIAERGWTKRIEAKCRVEAAAVDGIQRQLAAIRAQPALWVGEGDFPSLISYGFFKDFSQIVSLQGVSTCSLSINGLPAVDIAIPASDPALSGASDFQVVRPVTVTDAVLISSSVAEDDYPAYSSIQTYNAGDRVLVPALHRIFESLTGGNKGNAPASDAAHWVDAGPSKRWAMFDQALGSATTATGSIAVQLRPGSAVNALALLDLVAASVRVQAPGYDRTQPLGTGVTTAIFLDLAVAAGSDVTVTVTGLSGFAPVAVGTLLMGAREGLGLLADAPTSTFLDFSTKETDEFGQTLPVERAWAKKMEAQSQIATARADALMRRLATLRAVPALWIGASEFEALTIYGFFRDFTITLGETISTTSVTIEGLAKAAPDAPSDLSVQWSNITGPGKPADNATVGAPAGTNVGGVPAQDVANAVKDGAGNVVPARDQIAAVKAELDAAVASAHGDATAARDDAAEARDVASQARGDAAQARTDLAAEVQRAQGAEGTLTGSIAAVKTTADQAKAGVTDEATARATADSALADRLSVTEAQLGGSRDSGLRARISTEETARATADAVIANRTSSLEASAGTSAVGAALNPNFARWTDGDLTPASWNPWDVPGNARITRSSGTTVRGSPFAIYTQDDFAASSWGVVQTVWMSPGMWVVEAVVSMEQGDLSGAGVTLSGASNIDFVGDPDTAGLVGSVVGVRAFSKMVNWLQTGNVNLHAMVNWASFGRPLQPKYLRWFYLNVRPATDGEIKAGKALGDAGTALARITAEETARATQDQALADRLTITEAQLGGSRDSALRARISNEETARATNDDALADRLTNTEAQLAGSRGSQLQGRISTEETTRATADAAIASRTTSLEASASASAVGAALNPNFARYEDGAAYPANWNPWGMENGGRIARAAINPVRGSPYAADLRNDTADVPWGLVQTVAMSPGKWVIEAVASLDQGNLSGAGVTVSGVESLDFVGDPDTNGVTGYQTGLRAWSKMIDWTQPAGLVNLHAMCGWAGFGRSISPKYMRWMYLNVRQATDGEIKAGKALSDASSALSRITTEETTRATQDSALADRLSITEAQLSGSQNSQLQARIAAEETARANDVAAVANRTSTVEAQIAGTQNSPLLARVSTTESAIATLNGRAAAYWQVLAVAGSNRAQVTVRADANGGAGIDLVGDVNFKGSLDVGADSGGNRVKITNNGITFFDANSTYRGGMGLKA